MTYSWDTLLHTLACAISDIIGIPVDPTELVAPPNPELGDVAYGCFRVAKAHGKNSAEVARDLADRLTGSYQIIKSVAAAGPYVNISLDPGELIQRIVKDVEHGDGMFGAVDVGKGKELVLEYANPNTHKEIHVGHLRNFILGVALDRVLRLANWHVIPVSYVNDVGTHVAKCLWKLVVQSHFDPKDFSVKDAHNLIQSTPREQRTGKFLGDIYTQASRELEENPDAREMVSFVHQQLEKRVEAWEYLWKETKGWCINELYEIFEELGIKIEKQYFESEGLERSHEVVRDLVKKSIAHESEGALIVDFQDKKLNVAVLRKADGALLYMAKDLALAEQKIADYPDAKRSLIVVDKRQELNFKQLFEILKRLGFTQSFEHVGYEIVTLKEGVMSSRKGNIVTYQSFRDEVLQYAVKETRERHPDWTEGQVTYAAWCLAMAGIKFGMLRQDSDRIFVFDLEQSLSFDGATGPYVQYAVTRLNSILRKAGMALQACAKADLLLLQEETEKRLAIGLAGFPHLVARAADELRPSLVAEWCVDTASRINDFYRDVKVLDAPEEMKLARLRLVLAAKQVLHKGLELLGIPVPEEM